MEHQNQILQTLRAPESQARLERIVSQESLNNRAVVGRRVCAELGAALLRRRSRGVQEGLRAAWQELLDPAKAR